jgi:hypothetical protein
MNKKEFVFLLLPLHLKVVLGFPNPNLTGTDTTLQLGGHSTTKRSIFCVLLFCFVLFH